MSDIPTYAQKTAIEYLNGPMQVLAGPGSGKTFIIIRRLLYMIEEMKISPDKILVITFTNIAAQEMRERFEKHCEDKLYPVPFGTFHSVFYHILRQHPAYQACVLMKHSEKKYLISQIINELQDDFEASEDWKEDFLKRVSQRKNRLGTETDSEDLFFVELYNQYVRRCSAEHKIDFDDMLILCNRILEQDEELLKEWQLCYPYIMIDEFQDINEIQFHIVKMLTRESKNLFVVGDDDQSIYSFRGSFPDIMLHFHDYFPDAKQIVLEKNYRSCEELVRHSKCLIRHNVRRFDKDYHSAQLVNDATQENFEGSTNQSVMSRQFPSMKEELDELIKQISDEKEKNSMVQIAVLYRTTKHLSRLSEAFNEKQIPFLCKDRFQSIYSTNTSADLIAYLKFGIEKGTRADFIKIMNKPKRYLSRKAVLKATMNEKILFNELFDFYCTKPYMKSILTRLKYDLERIAGLDSYGALNYILKIIGYETYLAELNSEESSSSYEEACSVIEHFREISKQHTSIEEFLEYIEVKTLELSSHNHQNFQLRDRAPIFLSTLHGVKGMEFDVVFLINVNEGEMPHKKAVKGAQTEEERRLFYVGITRARGQLYLFYVEKLYGKKVLCSRFIEEMLI